MWPIRVVFALMGSISALVFFAVWALSLNHWRQSEIPRSSIWLFALIVIAPFSIIAYWQLVLERDRYVEKMFEHAT